MTGVGYGDMVPVTTEGRVFGCIVAVFGMFFLAVPAGLFCSGFTQIPGEEVNQAVQDELGNLIVEDQDRTEKLAVEVRQLRDLIASAPRGGAPATPESKPSRPVPSVPVRDQ